MIRILIYSTLIHICFFGLSFIDTNYLYSGKDMLRIHLSSKFFLNESFKNNIFPIWTDKMFGGYPIFFDLERGYQNIFNLALVYFFEPILALNLLFMIVSVIGFSSLILLQKKLFNLKLLYSLPLAILYFYSFLPLFHVQHQNMIFSIYLLPTIIFLTTLYIDKRNYLYITLNIIVYYFLITFGSLQSVFINLIFQIIFLIVMSRKLKDIFVLFLKFIIPPFIFTFPSIFYFFQTYLDSERILSGVSGQGRFELFHFGSYLTPFFLGTNNYYGTTLSESFFKQETLIYFSLSSFLLGVLVFLKNKPFFSVYKKLFLITLLVFLVSNFWPFFPFDMFRYWVRASYIVNFAIILLLAEFFSELVLKNQKNNLKFNKFQILVLSSILLLYCSNFFNRDFRFLFLMEIENHILLIVLFALIIVLLIVLFLKAPRYLIFLIMLEFLISHFSQDFNLIKTRDEVLILTKTQNNFSDTKDEFSLIKEGPSLSGYSSLTPRYRVDNNVWVQKYNFSNFLYFYLLSTLLTLVYLVIINFFIVKYLRYKI